MLILTGIVGYIIKYDAFSIKTGKNSVLGNRAHACVKHYRRNLWEEILDAYIGMYRVCNFIEDGPGPAFCTVTISSRVLLL